ncbi:SUMF1/EgtB/PvdO family nonheme iron enzyme [Bradyrhizobium jicamae]|uniref:SUMF1/EgtB/PvdO family nonheme iron enzyme n=1 Tax=Bradyrhizobium jicamae TaxID=280332 RepID=UPI001BAD7D91|nr:SUMF1/EgtB/PvdO family nonheme iron enzyme [Bradyrhizobium jicamae]MBR0934246.1 SUMF1/EgtB/PvdO family nonheme iron enzyme [Bradyrhizobium jicamae]
MLMLMKVKLALVAGALAAPVLTSVLTSAPAHDPDLTLRLSSVTFSYRAAGDFSRNGKPVAGPLRDVRLAADLVIMESLVTAGEYAACADDGACPRVPLPDALDVPIVGVSWHDASAYAAWISQRTGVMYRLPTDEEWTLAAAEKARDEVLPLVDPADPAQAWIARYEAESARSRPNEAAPRPIGTFGTNSNGLLDIGGNVWEWTNSCFIRASLDDGRERITNTNCGVRVVEGAHRTYMTDFIRDPKSGGCATGIPPTNLGFRLVVEPSPSVVSGLARNVTKLLRRT